MREKYSLTDQYWILSAVDNTFDSPLSREERGGREREGRGEREGERERERERGREGGGGEREKEREILPNQVEKRLGSY